MTRLEYVQAAGGFLLAALWSALAMPAAVNIGRRLGLVKRPRLYKSHRRHRRVSYLGGAAMIVAATAGFWLAEGISRDAALILGGGVVLFFVGFADDRSARGGLRPALRLVVETAVASVVVTAGVRLHVLASPLADGALSIFFLVAIANSFNLLDNMDGVAGATAAATSAGLFGLASLEHQHLVAILAATLCGSALGFLRLNLVRARLYMGNGGALFLGFLLGATAFKLRLPVDRSTDLLAIVACLAVPATDTSVVILSRLLGGRPVMQGGVDHVSHRLVRLGLNSRSTAFVHALAALAGSGAAALTVETRSPVPAGAALGVFAVAGLALLRVPIYETAASRPLRRLVAAAGLAVIAGIALSGATAALAERALVRGRADLLQARQSFRALDLASARAALDRAEPNLVRADDLLSSPATWPGRLLPGIRGNLSVAAALARSGRVLVSAGRQGVELLQALPLENGHAVAALQNGSIDLQPFVRAGTPAARLDDQVIEAQKLVASSHGALLLPPVRKARTEALQYLAEARRLSDAARAATVLVPRALGADGKQVWLLGAENNAELRGRGGYIGAFGVVEADQGHLALTSFVPTAGLPQLPSLSAISTLPVEYVDHYASLGGLIAWPNLTMSPAFASGANLFLSMLQAAGGPAANGAIGMDPNALADLLAVTGPVSLTGIPEQLTASNVVDWSVNRIYFLYPTDASRHAVLADVAQAVWQRILSGAVDPSRLAQAIGRALAGNHLVVYSNDPSLQALNVGLGIAGNLQQTSGDYLLVLGQNMAQSKLDYYLRRQVSYEGKLNSDGSLEAQLEVQVRNTAPVGTTLPYEVGGGYARLGLASGVDRTYLSVFVPKAAVLEQVILNGAPTTNVDDRLELGKRMFATYLEAGPQAGGSVVFHYRVPNVIVGNRYQLTLQNQATVFPDGVSIKVSAPDGAGVADDQGFQVGEMTWSGPLTGTKVLSADLRRPLLTRVADRVEAFLGRRALQVGG